MKKLAGIAVVLVAAGFGAFWALTRPASLPAQTLSQLRAHPADAAHGEAVFWAGGCASCHASPALEATST